MLHKIHDGITDAVLDASKAFVAALIPGLVWGLIFQYFGVLSLPVTFTAMWLAALLVLKRRGSRLT